MPCFATRTLVSLRKKKFGQIHVYVFVFPFLFSYFRPLRSGLTHNAFQANVAFVKKKLKKNVYLLKRNPCDFVPLSPLITFRCKNRDNRPCWSKMIVQKTCFKFTFKSHFSFLAILTSFALYKTIYNYESRFVWLLRNKTYFITFFTIKSS